MKAQNKAQAVKNTPVLLIFTALCALFGSGALIGVTVLSSPALGFRLFAALLPDYIVCFVVLFLIVLGFGSIYPPIAFLALPATCLGCGLRTVFASADYFNPLILAPIFTVLCAVTIIACAWALKTYPPSKQPGKRAYCALAITGAALAAVGSLALFAVFFGGRLQSLQTNNTLQASFGQMLYYMQHSASPFTTLFADQPQSYFATQFAPLWYAILPIYMLFGHNMLAVGIALYALMLSGLVPLWRICRRRTLSPMQTAAICAACALCPLIISSSSVGGSLAMLALPLLLWIADAMGGKRPYLALIPLVLSLCIGFEVTVWIAFVCLYLTLSAPRGHRRAGWVCTAVAMVGLIATVAYLAAVKSPVLTELFSGIGLQIGKKALFLMLLFVPLVLLPLLCRKKAALVLLVPLALFHLIANASVYSGVFCTYAYPTVAVAILLSVEGVANLRVKIREISLASLLPALALCAAMLFASPYAALLDQLYASPTEQEQADAARMQDLLHALPQNASVTASDSLLCVLHDRTWLFSLDRDPTNPKTNVIVLDLREYASSTDTEQYGVSYYQSLGYTLREEFSRDGVVAVLFK